MSTISIPLTQPAFNGSQANNSYHINIGIPNCTVKASHGVLIDTGSTGLVIPAALLYKGGAALVGDLIDGVTITTQKVQVPYHPSNIVLNGYIYVIAKLNIGVADDGTGAVYTINNAQVVGIYDNKTNDLGMCGIGFGRPQPFAPNLFLSPDSGVNPSYLLTKSANCITLGYTKSTLPSGFSFQQLQSNGTAAQDWLTPSATITVGTQSYSGTALLDTGITGMMMGIPGGWQNNPAIPSQQVTISWPTQPTALTYGFSVGTKEVIVVDSGVPETSYPVFGTSAGRPAKFQPVKAGTAAFVNTGINPIQLASYFYDSAAGVVGFQP